MSTRLRLGTGLVLALGLATWVSTAWAGIAQGQDGGDTVRVGALTNPSWPMPSGPSEPKGGASGSGSVCTYSPIALAEGAGFDLAPGGPTAGGWYLVQCPGSPALEDGRAQWIPTGSSTPAAPGPQAVESAGRTAEEAAAQMVLPTPAILFNPATFSVVNIATWLSIDPTVWHAYQATATAGDVTAKAVATPETVTWAMGDGGNVECQGPGTSFNPAVAVDAQSTDCSYTYKQSSAGQPSGDGDPNDGSFLVTATISWKVTWTAVGAPGGGTLTPLETTSQRPLRVEQVESVGVLP